MAVSKAGAAEKGVPLYKHISDLAGNAKLVLPVPAFNVINGGSHAGNKLAMQEFMILPVGAESFAEAMRMGSEVYHNLKSVIKAKYGQDACNVGDEGGFAPNIQENKEGLELLKVAIENAGYTGKIKIGMDVAAAEFYTEDKMYDLDFKTENNDGSMKKSGEEMIEMYKEFCAEYPIVSIEDPFDQDDFENTGILTGSGVCQVVGDDLRHEPRARGDRHRGQGLQRAPPQGEPDRLHLRGYRGGSHVQEGGLGRDGVAPLGRDGGLLHRRPRRRTRHGADQDRRALPLRATVQVQPAPSHRGRARRRRQVCG